MRGRKPEPGSERSLARVNHYTPTGVSNAIPGPPERLSTEAAKMWVPFVSHLIERGTFVESDAYTLVEGLEALAGAQEYRRQQAELNDPGSPEDKRLGVRYDNLMALWLKIAGAFGLDPVSRSRLGLTMMKAQTLMSHFEDID